MDRLQGWFDGGDLVNFTVGATAFALALWSLLRQRQIDRHAGSVQAANDQRDQELLAIQKRLGEIEEARHRDEQTRRETETWKARIADIRGHIRRQLNVKGTGYTYYLDLTNQGPAEAMNVKLDGITSRPPATNHPIIADCESTFPIPRMLAGQTVTLAVVMSMGMGSSFDLSVSWDDGRAGRQVATMMLTPYG